MLPPLLTATRNDLLGLEGMMKLTNPEDTLTGHGQGGGGLGGGLMDRDGTDGGPTDQTDCSEPESISKRFCLFFFFVISAGLT